MSNYGYGNEYRYNGLAKPAGSDYMNFGQSTVPLSFAMDYMNQGSQGGNPLTPNVGVGSLDILGDLGGQSAFDKIQAGSANNYADMGGNGMPDWLNWGNAQKVLGGIGMLGQVYAGIQQNKIAKDALAFKKKSYSENMDFQRQSYNTSLEARTRSQFHQEGRANEIDSYLAKHSLKG